VTKGFAGIKFSLSINEYPQTRETTKSIKIKSINPTRSLKEKNE
jgi:hypothetical protein